MNTSACNLLRRLSAGPIDLRTEPRRDVVAECYARDWIEPQRGFPGRYQLTRLGRKALAAVDAVASNPQPATRNPQQSPRAAI